MTSEKQSNSDGSPSKRIHDDDANNDDVKDNDKLYKDNSLGYLRFSPVQQKYRNGSDGNDCSVLSSEASSVSSVTLSPSPEPGVLIDEDLIIPQFHPNIIAPTVDTYMNPQQGGSKIALIGKPNTGKSVMLQYLMYSKRNIIPAALVMSGTESCTGFYSKVIPPLFIHNNYNENALIHFKERQLLARANCVNPWCLLVVDDCATLQNFKSSIQQDLFANGRHYKMLYLLSTQYPKSIPVTARACFDGVFLFGTGNSDVIKRLVEFAGDFPNKETFYKVFTEVTSQNYRALYIDYQNRKGKWYNNIYWAQAPPPNEIGPFKFGSDEYRKVGDSRVDLERVRDQCAYEMEI